jgi:hypothetical protein
MGDTEKLSDCPSGQIGSISHTCVCGSWLPTENKCVAPPQCTGTGRTTAGTFFSVDAVETQICPAGQSASPSSHKCLNIGNWDVPLGTCQTPPPPPVTCPGGVPVGTTESLTCSAGTGSPTRTCVAGGIWQTNGSCLLREGDICGSSQTDPAYIQACLPGSCIAQCPAGTDCGSRRIGRGPLVTTDWYCDRP